MKYPSDSIIILNWNGKIFLKKCLNSVFKLNYPNFEVIVVDNGSTDGSTDFVKKNYSKVKLIENKKNLGFAEGNNIGMRASKGKYVALLSNDTEVDKYWLNELIKAAESNGKIGMYASKVYFSNSNLINSTGLLIFGDGTFRNRGWKENDNGQYDKVDEVFGVYCAAGFFRKKMLKQIGLFDPYFFIYYEDADLAWRARLSGWKCIYVPTAVAYHIADATVKKLPDFKDYLMHRNRIWIIIKNLALSSILYYLPYIVITECMLIIYGLYKRSTADLKAVFGAVKGLPKFLKKRNYIQSTRKISEKEIRKFIVKPSFIKLIYKSYKTKKV